MTFGGAPKCIKCVKAVYFTEQVPGPGGLYHKTCLTCTECSKRLDSTSLTEKDGAPYCKSCYGKLFGPRGFGYGSAMASTDGAVRSSPTLASPGSVSSSRDSLANAAAPSTKAPSPTVTKTSVQGDGCPTCTKPVYFAEQVLSSLEF